MTKWFIWFQPPLELKIITHGKPQDLLTFFYIHILSFRSNNKTRTEDIELAQTNDRLVGEAWVGHPYYDRIDNSTDFETKMRRLCRWPPTNASHHLIPFHQCLTLFHNTSSMSHILNTYNISPMYHLNFLCQGCHRQIAYPPRRGALEQRLQEEKVPGGV